MTRLQLHRQATLRGFDALVACDGRLAPPNTSARPAHVHHRRVTAVSADALDTGLVREASLRGTRPIQRNVPCHCPMNDEEGTHDEAVMTGVQRVRNTVQHRPAPAAVSSQARPGLPNEIGRQ